MTTLLVLLAVILYCLVAFRDIQAREIPNSLVLCILILGLVRAVGVRTVEDAALSFAVALLSFALVLPLFIKGYLGGGDAKLIPVSVFLVGYDEAFGFAINMSLLGGALSLIILAGHFARARFRAVAGGAESPIPPPTVPYGVAIAGAAVAAVIH
jgi:prepilin peptidase CpaA